MMHMPKLRRWLGLTLLFGSLGLSMAASAEELVDVVKAAAAAKDPSEKAFYQDLAEMHQKLARASGLKLRLLVSDDEDVNAYGSVRISVCEALLDFSVLDKSGIHLT